VRTLLQPTYATQVLRPFWSFLRRYPQLPAALIEKAETADPERRVPVAEAQELLRGAVVLTGEQNLGLLAAREIQLGAFEVLEYAAASAPTWRAALETAFRYSHLMNEAANFHLDVVGDKAHVVLHSTVPLVRAGVDFQSAAFHVVVTNWLDPMPTEAEVWFSLAAPQDDSEYQKTFGPNALVFDAPFNGFVFDAARLETKLVSSDASLHGVLRQHAERLLAELAKGDGLVERVRAQVLATLKDGPVAAEDVAAQMGVTRRTLTRRLAQHGTSFTALLEEVRRQAATHYLRSTEHSIEDIAFLLGFSESSPFVRAFKRWTGLAPAAYRRASRGR
jgi:AraC-like DNA-binding protein